MDAKEISLEEKQVKPVVDHLNDLLANYHIHYQKLRGCHWNVKAKAFLRCILNSKNYILQPLPLLMNWPNVF